ncbi:MAG: DNA polymerase III subunit beta [Acidobacteria bacterium]|nr:DNA polymerase III subunit beta [Acidobacteriota bacterium]
MEFKINRSDLVRELGLSQGVVERKSTIPILSNVLIEAEEDRVVLTTTDLELGVRTSCPAKVKKAGTGTIPSKKLMDYVRLLPEGEITVKFADNQWASLTCGKSRTRIAGMSRESYPELPEMPATIAQIPVKALAGMIQRTIFAISAEESRFTLNGALLLVKPEGLVMVSTDSHRLATVEAPVAIELEDGKPFRALLPRKAMNELVKLAAESEDGATLSFSGDDNHLFFRLGERLLLSRKLTGNFPDFERVLPKEHANSITMSRDELRGSLERVMQFADERSRAIKFRANDGEITLHSSLSETGESEESLSVEYTGPKADIGFNAQYLLDFLRAIDEPAVTFFFKDAGAAGELRPAGDTNLKYRYVVMPMRI